MPDAAPQHERLLLSHIFSAKTLLESSIISKPYEKIEHDAYLCMFLAWLLTSFVQTHKFRGLKLRTLADWCGV